MSLSASIVLLGIVGIVVVFDLLSIIKRFDQQIEKNYIEKIKKIS